MLVSQAFAASEAVAPAAAGAIAAAAPSATESFLWNMGLILGMFVLFYVLLIRPQQRRLRAQQAMLSGLKKGDRVVTGGGLVGTISDILNEQEVVVDLGSGLKVTALRYTITAMVDPNAAKAS